MRKYYQSKNCGSKAIVIMDLSRVVYKFKMFDNSSKIVAIFELVSS